MANKDVPLPNSNSLRVLLVGHSKPSIDELHLLLTKLPGLQVELRVLGSQQFDPLQSVLEQPDVLLIDLGEYGENILKALLTRPADARPIILAVSSMADNTNLMRLAMQVGARDFFKKPVLEKEIITAFRQISLERAARSRSEKSKLSVVVNARGGVGSSTVACNLAYIMASQMGLRTLLMDMDLQFGTQALHLNLTPEQGIFELLAEIDQLDLVALDVFLTKHRSGLRLLSKLPDQLGLPGDLPIAKLGQLLDMLLVSSDHVVVDLPRLVDPVMTTFVERADHFIICIEQSVASLRDAQRLMAILKQDLDFAPEKVILVVNRYHPKVQIHLEDIQRALQVNTIHTIPNDYKQVVTAANLGTPVVAFAPKIPVSLSLMKLATDLCGVEIDSVQKGLIGRLFSRSS